MPYKRSAGILLRAATISCVLVACGGHDGTPTVADRLQAPQSAVASATTRQFANGFYIETGANSTPAQVYRLYRAAFAREADAAGLGYHVGVVEVFGHSLLEVAGNFVASAEFRTTYGNIDDEAFVTLLYSNVLRRAPDAAGRDYWKGQLASGMSRPQALLGFAESAENKNQTAAAVAAGLVFKAYPDSRVYLADGMYLETAADGLAAQVYRLYQAAFDRVADPGGLGFQVGSIESLGITFAQVATNFVASAEFLQRYGTLTDAQFITQLYRNVLRRPPDAGGLKFYQDQLAGGTSRAQVLVSFSESAENKANTNAAVSLGIRFVPYPKAPAVPAVDLYATLPPFSVDRAIGLWGVAADGQGGDSAGDGGAGGAAGDGAPLKRATVVLVDSLGHSVSGKTDDNGNYFLRFNTQVFKPPFLVKVIDSGGNVLSSATEEAVGNGMSIRINVNTLTDKIASDALTTGVPGVLSALTGAQVSSQVLPQAKANLRDSISAALTTAGIADPSQFDPVRSVYAQDGNGIDAISESVRLSRHPVTGATQLSAKVGAPQVAADGTVSPVLITAAAPLPSAQVVLSGDAALTLTKLSAWMRAMNDCLAASTAPGVLGCSAAKQSSVASATYLHDSRDFAEDLRTFCRTMGAECNATTRFLNANVAFVGRYTGSNADDMAVVDIGFEVTVGTTRRQLNRFVFFHRDDAAAGLAAGNWVAHGNQSVFDWEVYPFYSQTRYLQPNPTLVSYQHSYLLCDFKATGYDRTTQSYVANNVYAVRLTGPGLPAAGLVFAPGGGGPQIVNKTGAIPPPGTQGFGGNGFLVSAINLATMSPYVPYPAIMPDDPANFDFSKLQAFSRYKAEFYLTGQAQPVVDFRYLPTAVMPATQAIKRVSNDFSPSFPLLTPPHASSPTALVQWGRRVDAASIFLANFFQRINGQFESQFINLPDAYTANATSNTLTFTNGNVPFSAFNGIKGERRGIMTHGIADRAIFQYWFIYEVE